MNDEDGIEVQNEVALLRRLIDGTQTAIMVAERSTFKVLYANDAWCKLQGVPAGVDIVGTSPAHLASQSMRMVSPGDIAALDYDTFTVLERTRPSGERCMIRARLTLWNGVEAFALYAYDVTAEYEARRKLETLLDNLPGGVLIYEVDASGTLTQTYANDGYLNMIGVKRAERPTTAHGAPPLEMVNPEDLPNIRSALKTLLGGEDFAEEEHRVLDGAGLWRWIRLRVAVAQRMSDHLVVYATVHDIQKEHEQRVRAREDNAMLRVALDIADASICRLDFASHAMIMDTELAARFGLPPVVPNIPESLIAAGSISPEFIEPLRAFYERVYAGEAGSIELLQRYNGDERYRWGRISYRPLLNDDGTCTEAVGISADIDKSKRRETFYREQLSRYTFVANDAIASAIVDLDEGLVRKMRIGAGEPCVPERPMGADELFAEIVGKKSFERERPRFKEFFERTAILETFARGDAHAAMRFRREGAPGWLELRYDVMANPDNDHIEAFVSVRDVSAAVRTEHIAETLSNVDYESVFTVDVLSAMPDYTGTEHLSPKLFDASGEPLPFDEAMDSYLRFSCVDLNLDDIIDSMRLDVLVSDLKSAKVCFRHYSVATGAAVRQKRMLFTYLANDPRTILGAVQDMTEQYQADTDQKALLREALEKARVANRAKTDFLSNMSHDMRTPMNGILGLIALANDKDDVASIKEDLTQIGLSAQYLLRLINDTLDMSKIEAGKLELKIAPINSEELFKNILSAAYLQAEAYGVNLVVSTPNIKHGSWVRVLGDASRIEQVMMNVISNAIKYTPAGGTVELAMQTVSISDTEVVDRYVVKDNGIGMSEEFQRHMFEPFTQEGRAGMTHENGTGLGMSIIKELMSAMGNTFEVKSALDVGTEVSLVFHYAVAKDLPPDAQAPEVDLGVLDGRTVLLCEDHPINRDIAVKLLAKKGVSSLVAENGAVGVRMFQEHADQIDAVLMDVRMPVMGGIEATHAIRALPLSAAQTVPIIAMTANAFKDDVEACLEAGMNAHMAKPFQPQTLYETLARSLG